MRDPIYMQHSEVHMQYKLCVTTAIVLVSHSNSPRLENNACTCILVYLYNSMKRRLSGTNFSLENSLPTFQLNAPVVIRV